MINQSNDTIAEMVNAVNDSLRLRSPGGTFSGIERKQYDRRLCADLELVPLIFQAAALCATQA